MKKKVLSDYPLEVLLKQKIGLKSAVIGWIIVLAVMVGIAKYSLFPTFIPLAITLIVPIYISMNGTDAEIKKR
ncbi:hypothetical protein [Flavobacterium sp.]|uniref:hypothetical protein n=1 Tax=Flavobacterium sp. TaxID=239 RepID=UPI003D6B7251